MSESHELDGEPLDRRAAIKKVVGGAVVGGAVWSAPRIEGLTLRPNYAAAQTGPAPQGLSMTISDPTGFSSRSSPCSAGPGSFFVSASRTSGGAGVQGSHGFIGGVGTVNAVTINPGTWSIQRSSTGTGTGNFSANLLAGQSAEPITISVEFNCA